MSQNHQRLAAWRNGFRTAGPAEIARLMTLSTTSHSSDAATGLITGVQPVYFLPNAEVVIDDRIATGDLAK
jgi:hypothetical protein